MLFTAHSYEAMHERCRKDIVVHQVNNIANEEEIFLRGSIKCALVNLFVPGGEDADSIVEQDGCEAGIERNESSQVINEPANVNSEFIETTGTNEADQPSVTKQIVNGIMTLA